MNRRDFINTSAIACSSILSMNAFGEALPNAGTSTSAKGKALTKTQEAYQQLLLAFSEIEQGYLSERFGVTSPEDIADGHRFLMHLYQQALTMAFEQTPEHPRFQRVVTPTMKLGGDNPDAVYHQTSIRGGMSYLVRGNRANAVYFSFAVQSGSQGKQYGDRVSAELNDTGIQFADDGSFELYLSPTDPGKANWFKIPEDAVDVLVRHYFEEPESAAADATRTFGLEIEPIGDIPPPPTPNDESIAASIHRVIDYARRRTLDNAIQPGDDMPAWISHTPNYIPKPLPPGDLAYAAVDSAYAMSPYLLANDEALVIRGKWPRCRFANVSLWNRYTQTYDYANRQIWLNRAKTQLDSDGYFTMVLAHKNPGVPNWIDTEGRNTGTMYWRYFLPEGEIVTPVAEVVKFGQLSL